MQPHLDRTRRAQRTQLTAVAVAVVVFVVVGAQIPNANAAVLVSNLGQVAAPLFAALAFAMASRRAVEVAAGAPERRALRFLGASALSWGLGQAVWTWYEITDVAAPYPSFADVGYLVAVPLAMLGVWALAARVPSSSRAVAVVDGLIVAGSLLLVSWPLLLGPSWAAGGDSVFAFVLSLAYPIGNLVVASSLVLVIMRSGRRAGGVSLMVIAAGLAALVAADSVFVWSALNGTEQTVSPADFGWMSGYLILGLAAVRYPEPGGIAPGRRRTEASLRRAVLPFTIAFVALVVRVGLVVVGYRPDPFLTGLTVFVVVLCLARHLATMRENQQLTWSLEEKIQELTAREEQLSHQALHDPLTGLANRRLFTDRVEHAIARGRRSGDLSSVLFIDLDDFKTVNDSLGHAAGDQLLVAVGARLGGCVRPGDTVARLGGDEFGILLESFERADHPTTVADRMLAVLDQPFPLAGRQVYTRASIGIATSHPLGEDTGEELLADADVALYAAKAAGKSGYRHFERVMRVSAVERLELGQDLREAIHASQFRCEYQPIVDLVSGRIVALEALVRWEHPTRGVLPPSAFISLAEEMGTIGEIGRFVLAEALDQFAAWRSAGQVPPGLELHVNLSGHQVEEADLPDQVFRMLATAGVPASLLVLEITETVAVEVGARHLDRLESLRELGIRLAIDDFGTGYSSLNYLRALPVDVLKIDRAFAQTTDGRTDAVLLEAIVRLGHSLGIEMIAEGIELEEQAAALRRLGCRQAQGYLFHRPLAADAVPDRVQDSLRLGSSDRTPHPGT